LDESLGVRAVLISRDNVRYKTKFDGAIFNGLVDRRDGVALMAQALVHASSLGKYRDFIRLFELAFALDVNSLGRKMTHFLTDLKLGYTRSEIDSWLALRHGASHGDLKVTRNLVFEADTSPVVDRMEQAAWDILCNKLVWHDRSRVRRDFLRPLAYTTSPNRDIAVIQGAAVDFQAQFFDEFDVYPMDLAGVISNPPPSWWWKPRNGLGHEGCRVETEEFIADKK
jgi:hypothetical protein